MADEFDPSDDQTPLVDLKGLSFKDLEKLKGNPALEATLRRLLEDVTTPREAVSGFSSAV